MCQNMRFLILHGVIYQRCRKDFLIGGAQYGASFPVIRAQDAFLLTMFVSVLPSTCTMKLEVETSQARTID